MAGSAANISDLLQKALHHHQAGRLKDAEGLYRAVLTRDKNNANALNLLGVIAAHRGKNDIAREFYGRAIKAAPHNADIHFNLGILLAVLGDGNGALSAYDRAIALRPDFVDAHLNRGVSLRGLGYADAAIAAFRKTVEIAPYDARGYANLGRTLAEMQRLGEAEENLRRAIALNPTDSYSCFGLAKVLADAGLISEGVALMRRTVAQHPSPEAYSDLGDLLKRANDIPGAVVAHRVAMEARPDDPLILYNFGATLYAARRNDEAQVTFERAIELSPRFTKAYIGLAKVLEYRRRFSDAVGILEKALSFDPESPELLFKLALCDLSEGNFERGWRNYEARFSTPDKTQIRRAVPPPYWQGESLSGKTILVWTEQGIGDQILYSSMIADVCARAARCIIECEDRLAPVFARSFPHASVVSYRDQGVANVPPEGIDYQIAAASLGRFLRPDFSSFPRPPGYLAADPHRTALLRRRYKDVASGNILVGLSWQSKNPDIGEIKSANLVQWADILNVSGVTFVNLQYGDCSAEIDHVRTKLGVTVLEDREIDPLRDMDGFFAQVAALDLVISSSNTTAHVAGSLNVPVWLLLLSSPAELWYWFRDRDENPWYRSLKAIRAGYRNPGVPDENPWREVSAEAAEGLKQLTALHRNA